MDIYICFLSTIDQIRSALRTNARLLQAERSRVDLVARMSGISLNQQHGGSHSRCISASSQPTVTVNLAREQRDTALFRRLTMDGGPASTLPKRLPPAITAAGADFLLSAVKERAVGMAAKSESHQASALQSSNKTTSPLTNNAASNTPKLSMPSES